MLLSYSLHFFIQAEANRAARTAREEAARAAGADGAPTITDETAGAPAAAPARKRARKSASAPRPAASNVAEAVEGELRRNKSLSHRINYDVVSLLSQVRCEATIKTFKTINLPSYSL